MSTITEKLKWLIEADATSAIHGFEKTGAAAEASLKKAETHSQKLGGTLTKVGAGSLVVAGIVGAAMFEVAKSFEESALKAGEFSDATGLSVEDASRWIAVGKDVGVGADTLQTAIGKMNKTLGSSPQKFKDLGIEVAATKSGTEDVNGTFLNTIDRLNAIEDPALRASTAASIFGKGWQGAAELLKLSTDDIKTQLASVSDARVINEEELAKAKAFRDQLNEMKNSVKDLTMAVGQGAMPVIGGFVELLSHAVKGVASLDAVTGGAAGSLLAGGAAALGMVGALTLVGGQVIKMKAQFENFGGGVKAGMGVAAIAILAYTINAQQAAKANADLATSIDDVSRASDAGLMQAYFDVVAKGFLANKTLKETEDELAKSNIEGAQRIRDKIQAMVDAGTANAGQIAQLAVLKTAIDDEKAARVTAGAEHEKYKSSTDDATAALDADTLALNATKLATDLIAAAQAEATRKSDAFKTSLQGQIDKLAELYPKEYNAVTAKYDYAKQTETTMIAVDNMNTTLANHKSKQEDVKTATDAARDAIIQQSEKFATLDGAALGSEGAIRRQIASLTDQAASLAPGSPLRVYLEQYISDLANIPSNVSTTLALHVSSNATNAGAPGYVPRNAAHIAEGGIVMPRPGGVPAIIAEAGVPEAVIPLDGKHDIGGPQIIVNNYRRDLTVGDLNQLLAMARLS